MYENEINLLRFLDQERAVKGETGEACAAPNHIMVLIYRTELRVTLSYTASPLPPPSLNWPRPGTSRPCVRMSESAHTSLYVGVSACSLTPSLMRP